ncbi:hypothetical protein ABGB12_28420 [Actinocorallia sp. B10E7]|uniref:hypothetical protein n=1 Tax=Actinocorallia sp. B10E7 TaxID=3153558 RepID=UPI00325D9FF0
MMFVVALRVGLTRRLTVRTRWMIEGRLSPSIGGLPVAANSMFVPQAQMSTAVVARCPWNSSGAIQRGFP